MGNFASQPDSAEGRRGLAAYDVRLLVDDARRPGDHEPDLLLRRRPRLEEGKRSPASRAKLGKKRYKNERRILSFDETTRVLVHLEEPNLLIIETCIATGARISEVLL